MSDLRTFAIAALLIATPAMAQPPRPHAQLETPLISTGNWRWAFAWDIEHDFPYRWGPGGHPELLRGTYVDFSSSDPRYATGINFHEQYLAERAVKVNPK